MLYEAIADVGKRCDAKVKSLSGDKVDPELIAMIAAEAKIAERLSAAFRKAATAASDQRGSLNAELLEVETENVAAQLRTRHEVVRASLSRKYDKPFRAIKETTGESDEAASSNQNGYRTWTSKNGKSHVKAMLIRAENGVVKLETANGKKITVAIEKLSDEDRQFIEKNASQPSPKQPK